MTKEKNISKYQNYNIDIIINYILDNFYKYNKPTRSSHLPYNILFESKYKDLNNSEIEEIWKNPTLHEINYKIFDSSNLKKKIDEYFTVNNSIEDYYDFFNNTDENIESIINFFECNETEIKKINQKKKDRYGYEIQKINKRIKYNFKDKEGYLTPGFYSYKQFNEEAPILFIGLNPAGDDEKYFGEIGSEGIDIVKKRKIILDNTTFYDYATFYGPFQKMFGHFHLGEWNQVDLFQYRGTKSKMFEEVINIYYLGKKITYIGTDEEINKIEKKINEHNYKIKKHNDKIKKDNNEIEKKIKKLYDKEENNDKIEAYNLIIRKNNNRKMRNFIITPEGKGKLGDTIKSLINFIDSQYDLFLDFLNILKPEIIIVSNAFASEFIKYKFYNNYHEPINMEKGYWEIPKKILKSNGDEFEFDKKPKGILFVQQFSSGRTDNGSMELIKWRINDFLNKEKQKQGIV